MNITKRTRSILHILSVLVGFIYLVSGFAKAIDIKEFYYTIANYGFQPLNFLAPLIVIFEIALGVSLILRIRLKLSAFISSVTIVVFTLMFTYAYVFRDVEDCGCFGSFGTGAPPIWFFLRNFLILIISITVFLLYPKETIIAPYKKSVFFFMLLIAAYMVGFTYNNPIKLSSGKKKVFVYAKSNIKDTPLGKYAPETNDFSYMLYFFSYSCPHCLNSMENIKQYTTSGFVDNIVLIGTGAKESLDYYSNHFKTDYQHIDISEEAMKEAINTLPVPVSFFIVNDTVRKIWQGTLPVHQNLRKIRYLGDYGSN